VQDNVAKAGRLLFPLPLFAYPFYLWHRSPGKSGSHYSPSCDLFKPSEKGMVITSDAFMVAMVAVLGYLTTQLGPLAMFNLYVVPYWINVVWLDVVTYLHHHGPSDENEKMPWYRCDHVSAAPIVGAYHGLRELLFSWLRHEQGDSF
jgi:acyl-lipid omega-3 desaturase